jgi:hypothetical protein
MANSQTPAANSNSPLEPCGTCSRCTFMDKVAENPKAAALEAEALSRSNISDACEYQVQQMISRLRNAIHNNKS